MIFHFWNYNIWTMFLFLLPLFRLLAYCRSYCIDFIVTNPLGDVRICRHLSIDQVDETAPGTSHRGSKLQPVIQNSPFISTIFETSAPSRPLKHSLSVRSASFKRGGKCVSLALYSKSSADESSPLAATVTLQPAAAGPLSLVPDRTHRCGVAGFRPDWLQRLATPTCMLFWMCWFCLVQVYCTYIIFQIVLYIDVCMYVCTYFATEILSTCINMLYCVL